MVRMRKMRRQKARREREKEREKRKKKEKKEKLTVQKQSNTFHVSCLYPNRKCVEVMYHAGFVKIPVGGGDVDGRDDEGGGGGAVAGVVAGDDDGAGVGAGAVAGVGVGAGGAADRTAEGAVEGAASDLAKGAATGEEEYRGSMMSIFGYEPDDLISVSDLVSLISWVVIVPDYQTVLDGDLVWKREKRYGERVPVWLMLVNERKREKRYQEVMMSVVILTIDEMRKRAQGGE